MTDAPTRDDHRLTGLLDLACPTCGATPGEDCWADDPHDERVDLADDQAALDARTGLDLAA